MFQYVGPKPSFTLPHDFLVKTDKLIYLLLINKPLFNYGIKLIHLINN